MPISPNVYSLHGSQLTVGYATGVAAAMGPFLYQDDAFQATRLDQNQLNVVATSGLASLGETLALSCAISHPKMLEDQARYLRRQR
jgi:hypothetical protein